MDTNEIKHLLKKYQEGTCTEDEYNLVNEWLDKERSAQRGDSGAIDQHLLHVKAAIDRQILPKPFSYRRYLNIAAIVFLLCSGVLLTYTLVNREKPAIVSKVKKVNRKVERGWVKLSTPRGVKHSFKLPDGSLVTLNASSSVRYPEEFSGNTRPVYLDEGEAYFTVEKDESRPFTVFSSDFATTALGTAFNVRAYQRERKVMVALLQGKVKVEDLRRSPKKLTPSILQPSQQIVINTASTEATSRKFSDKTPVIGWKEGLLSFEEASIDEVITSIENKFDVTVINKTAHSDWKYTGTFHNESLQEVVQTICLTEGITYKVLSPDSIQLN